MVNIIEFFKDNFKSVEDLEKYGFDIPYPDVIWYLIKINWDVNLFNPNDFTFILENKSEYSETLSLYNFLSNIEVVNFNSVVDKDGNEIGLLSFGEVILLINITLEQLMAISIVGSCDENSYTIILNSDNELRVQVTSNDLQSTQYFELREIDDKLLFIDENAHREGKYREGKYREVDYWEDDYRLFDYWYDY